MTDLNEKKYLVCPGYVESRTDGDIHYVGFMELMRLYGVKPEECAVFKPELTFEYPRHLRVLRPQYDGRYEL